MRAALLPAGGDPFLLAYWLRNYRTWADQVDILRVVVCDQPDFLIQEYLRRLADDLPHVVIRFAPRTDHGEIIRQLVNETNADTVFLCEDDAFVRRPSAVGEAFDRIERNETDVVGCPRATGSESILNWARERYGNWQASTGESGPILWPCFLFARRDDLLRTDGHFGAQGWKAGDSVLGRILVEDEAMDTFGWATLQLREMGMRIHVEPNYRAQKEVMGSWAWKESPWFHVGGLSAGYGMYLLGPKEHQKGFWASIRGDLYDWQKRMSWWQRVVEKWDGALKEHHEAYLNGLNEFMSETGMNPADVAEWRTGFDGLITWAE